MSLTQSFDFTRTIPLHSTDFLSIFEAAPGLCLVLTLDLRIVAVGNDYLKAATASRAEIVGRSIFDLLRDDPADPSATGIANLKASFDRVIASAQPDAIGVQRYHVHRLEAAGGGCEERQWTSLNVPVVGGPGEVRYIIHRVEDATELIRLKNLDREQEQLTQALRVRAEHMQGETLLWAQEVSEGNERLRRANSELAALCHQASLLMAQAEADLKIEGEDRRDPPIGPEDMLVRVGRMIASHKRMEEQLRQSQKMEALGRVSAGVAHDFSNLLTLIIGYTALLQARLPAVSEAPEIKEIAEAAARGSLVTKKLLAFSRKQVLQPRMIDLNAALSGIEGLLQCLLGDNISLVTALAPDLGMVKVDPDQVEQVIMNLAVNARDAMSGGGKLTIETKNVMVATDEVRGLAAGAYIVISMRDTGHGIDDETAGRIFEPFFTTKGSGKGTGFGLSTAFGIAEQSGGALTVQSQPGAGATFQVYLPRTEPAAERSPAAPSNGQPSQEIHVLLVEDEVPLRQLVGRVLKAAGYRVLEANTGEEALYLGAQHSGRIDLLITDVMMPGISGSELVSRLRLCRNDFMVLFVSGYTQDLVDQKALEVRDNFLPKPFTPRALLAKVNELLVSGRDMETTARRYACG